MGLRLKKIKKKIKKGIDFVATNLYNRIVATR